MTWWTICFAGLQVVLSEDHNFCCKGNKKQCVWMMWDRGTRRFLILQLEKQQGSRLWGWNIQIREMNSHQRKVQAEYFGVSLAQQVGKVVTWLILPVVICLSQRLSHACLSINKFVLWNCEWLIKSVIVYLMLHCYMDNCGNSRANTCNQAPTSGRGVFIR